MRLFIRGSAGDATYVACIHFERVTKGINIHPND
jgi:hypothetical protein